MLPVCNAFILTIGCSFFCGAVGVNVKEGLGLFIIEFLRMVSVF